MQNVRGAFPSSGYIREAEGSLQGRGNSMIHPHPCPSPAKGRGNCFSIAHRDSPGLDIGNAEERFKPIHTPNSVAAFPT